MITQRRILELWWPLAASWLLMGAEMPLVVGVVSRLPDPDAQLAAIASIIYPIALLIEGPIIMLLAASTALAVDRRSYSWLSRAVWIAIAVLTAVHAACAFTPLYDVIAADWMRAPPDTIEPGRIGLQLLTPWTSMIAYRRFQHGLLIRHERSHHIGIGTGLRLSANAIVLTAGYLHGGYCGAAVGAAAIAAGVTADALYAAWAVREARAALPEHDPTATPLTWRRFRRFYVPLAITPLLTLALQPIGAAAMNRMPSAMPSLAAWGAVYGLIFMLRSFGFAYQEVAVRLSSTADGARALRRFAHWLAWSTSGALLLIWSTPLAQVWFGTVSGLRGDVLQMATFGVGFGVLMPAYAVWINYYQGVLVQAHVTRPVTGAVLVYVGTAALLLQLAVGAGAWPGLPATLCALTVAGLCQTAWLHRAARARAH